MPQSWKSAIVPSFLALMQKLKHNIRHLLDVPNHYHILFMQGGARTQFSAIAQNFRQ